MNEYKYYCTRNTQAQRGIYKLLRERHKIDLDRIIELIKLHADKLSTGKPEPIQKHKVLEEIENNFGDFLKTVTEHTGIVFKESRHKKRVRAYDELWQQSNLDGSFAYNGVTDDF